MSMDGALFCACGGTTIVARESDCLFWAKNIKLALFQKGNITHVNHQNEEQKQEPGTRNKVSNILCGSCNNVLGVQYKEVRIDIVSIIREEGRETVHLKDVKLMKDDILLDLKKLNYRGGLRGYNLLSAEIFESPLLNFYICRRCRVPISSYENELLRERISRVAIFTDGVKNVTRTVCPENSSVWKVSCARCSAHLGITPCDPRANFDSYEAFHVLLEINSFLTPKPGKYCLMLGCLLFWSSELIYADTKEKVHMG